jgi:hypothetical protein
MNFARISTSAVPVTTGARLTTSFEDWCEAHGLHPEERGAWDLYQFLGDSGPDRQP